MSNLKVGLLGFQEEYIPMINTSRLFDLEEQYGELVEKRELDKPVEVAVLGTIYKVVEYRDYSIRYGLHVINMLVYPLDCMEEAPLSSREKTSVVLTALDGEDGTYKKIIDSLKGEGIVDEDLEALSLSLKDVDGFMSDLLREEYCKRYEILYNISKTDSDPEKITQIFNSAFQSYGLEFSDIEEKRKYVLDAIDAQATINCPVGETAEYLLQEPFPTVMGIVDKKTKEVNIIPDLLYDSVKERWCDVVARDAWRASSDKEVRECECSVIAPIKLLARAKYCIELSLLNVGVRVKECKDGTCKFKKASSVYKLFRRNYLKKLILIV